jgi:uncharacterized protein (DUF4415 family)
MKNGTKAKEIIVEVTEAEYRRELATGLREDEVLKPGRHKFKRGGFLARHGIKPDQVSSQVKVRVSIDLDLDVLNYFKQRAASPNAAPYQAQINNTLREVMERELASGSTSFVPQTEALLADRRFIEAVAKQVKSVGATTRKRSRRAA